MVTREEVRQRMRDDGIEFLLVQFVDINGSPKVKMVPVSHFDDVIGDGAGFAGAALPGMGQGPHSHDMMARIDIDTYTPVPLETRGRSLRLRPLRGRRGAPVLPSHEPEESAIQRTR